MKWLAPSFQSLYLPELVTGEDHHCLWHIVVLRGGGLRSLALGAAANDEGHVVGAVPVEIALGLGDLDEAAGNQRPLDKGLPGEGSLDGGGVLGTECGQRRQGECGQSCQAQESQGVSGR